MRVLMLSKALVVGAYQVKLEEMARQPGVDLTVVVPPYWQEGRQRLTLEHAHTQGYGVEVQTMALNGHYHLHFYPGLPGVLRRVRPDVFHIDEEPYNHATFQATVLGRSVGARCLFFTWQNLYRPQPWNLLQRYVLSHSDGAIAGNEEAASILHRKGFRRPTTVIPQFGVDPNIYRPMPQRRAGRQSLLPASIAPAAFVIGYVGRLVEQKGLLVLLRAVAGLAGEWRLIIIGSGPLQAEVERLAADLGIARRLSLVPSVPSSEVPLWLNTLDCLVLPSLTRPNWKEQFGRVLVEAMSCQIPVVGSDSGEMTNVIGDAGLVAHEGDADHLRQQIALLIEDASLRQRLAEAGRRRVLARFTQASIARATCAFYHQVMDSAR